MEDALAIREEEGIEKGIGIGREEGIEIGDERGTLRTLCNLVSGGNLSLEVATATSKLSKDEFLTYLELYRSGNWG